VEIARLVPLDAPVLPAIEFGGLAGFKHWQIRRLGDCEIENAP
jgi:hypothetical protein